MFLKIGALKNFTNLTGKQTPTGYFSVEILQFSQKNFSKKTFFNITPVVATNQKKLPDPYLGFYQDAPP